jgi:hypothetical protein
LNQYVAFANNPVNFKDPTGQDVWRIRAKKGWGHEWIVGNNSDGTFWSVDSMPTYGERGGFVIRDLPVYVPATINFRVENSAIDPFRLDPSEYEIIGHAATSFDVTQVVRQEAESRSKNKGANWHLVSDNCRDFAAELLMYARTLQRSFDAQHGTVRNKIW